MQASEKAGEPTDWIGRERVSEDVISGRSASRWFATIRDKNRVFVDGEPVPYLSHWAAFPPQARLSDLDTDGHSRKGAFLPPVELPRRMWAGSRVVFSRPLLVGAVLTRRSFIADVQRKSGRTGPLVFVTIENQIRDSAGVCVTDTNTLVYRGEATGDAPLPADMAPLGAQWVREIMPSTVLLFRYSALTFNGHRIHFDRDYSTEVEGYPGLVVHGPMVATLLLHELISRHPDRAVNTFSFRAVRPIFDTGPFFLCGAVDGDVANLFAKNEAGELCLRAMATFDG